MSLTHPEAEPAHYDGQSASNRSQSANSPSAIAPAKMVVGISRSRASHPSQTSCQGKGSEKRQSPPD